MQFRPCIDLHNGKVKQIVGSTLKDDEPESLQINFTADHPSTWFAELYRRDNLTGGHIIKLGPGNDQAAAEALAAWPGGLQIGGGISADNGREWLDKGASHVIVTSYVFREGQVDRDRLQRLVTAVGKKYLVLDLSCRRRGSDYYIVTDRWQNFTDVIISPQILEEFSNLCDEFLIHAADVEGQCRGIETELVKRLAEWSPIPTTYAGGVKDLSDMELIRDLGQGRLHATVGSALDIFGGTTMTYQEVVAFHKAQQQ
ncbi:MAG: phosphoribosylformimino-5-aminoimidazole carboxamide ribotide isomerase [Proteobacteria bacterium]|nr:phosphoribosylformimino-5-aminoimidazole carboxamide ribotide isomerase [Pseudomonadota bacterium]MBU1232397.1 phosphoribosylformimino-5-aminoimidazole carboxamide ribotide isomerase [Pseudomonadota bacterium]MBU1417184.1 phosphoribosylformimino-5-aminoimidazole carboxamide ribotide isomerase [Pseudomonadota bacterium]MBU1453642.1 phosphoribosylformimino-5-aminoimidazole carboxamide ribotide isomerase [Pseudomonadota bacterium]